MPIIAVVCEKYKLQIMNSWRSESGAPQKEVEENLAWLWRSPDEDGLPSYSDGAHREIYEGNPCELEKQLSAQAATKSKNAGSSEVDSVFCF